jgi:hypothetical protein
MKYLLMICTDEAAESRMPEAGMTEMMKKYFAFTQDAKDKGVYIGGNALQPTTTATTVRVRDGKTITSDGPFTETKEQIGGYYLFECKDLDEAIAWAARIPGASHGAVEVRPIRVFS